MNLVMCVLTWQWVILICWIWLLIVVGIVSCRYLQLRFFSQPCLNHIHELDMKEKAFNHEKIWYYLKKMEEPLEEELERSKKELDDLKNKEKELNSFKQEKERYQIELLEEKIKLYEEVINNIRG